MLILDLWGISFHPVVVVALGNEICLPNFILGQVSKCTFLPSKGFSTLQLSQRRCVIMVVSF